MQHSRRASSTFANSANLFEQWCLSLIISKCAGMRVREGCNGSVCDYLSFKLCYSLYLFTLTLYFLSFLRILRLFYRGVFTKKKRQNRCDYCYVTLIIILHRARSLFFLSYLRSLCSKYATNCTKFSNYISCSDIYTSVVKILLLFIIYLHYFWDIQYWYRIFIRLFLWRKQYL